MQEVPMIPMSAWELARLHCFPPELEVEIAGPKVPKESKLVRFSGSYSPVKANVRRFRAEVLESGVRSFPVHTFAVLHGWCSKRARLSHLFIADPHCPKNGQVVVYRRDGFTLEVRAGTSPDQLSSEDIQLLNDALAKMFWDEDYVPEYVKPFAGAYSLASSMLRVCSYSLKDGDVRAIPRPLDEVLSIEFQTFLLGMWMKIEMPDRRYYDLYCDELDLTVSLLNYSYDEISKDDDWVEFVEPLADPFSLEDCQMPELAQEIDNFLKFLSSDVMSGKSATRERDEVVDAQVDQIFDDFPEMGPLAQEHLKNVASRNLTDIHRKERMEGEPLASVQVDWSPFSGNEWGSGHFTIDEPEPVLSADSTVRSTLDLCALALGEGGGRLFYCRDHSFQNLHLFVLSSKHINQGCYSHPVGVYCSTGVHEIDRRRAFSIPWRPFLVMFYSSDTRSAHEKKPVFIPKSFERDRSWGLTAAVITSPEFTVGNRHFSSRITIDAESHGFGASRSKVFELRFARLVPRYYFDSLQLLSIGFEFCCLDSNARNYVPTSKVEFRAKDPPPASLVYGDDIVYRS